MKKFIIGAFSLITIWGISVMKVAEYLAENVEASEGFLDLLYFSYIILSLVTLILFISGLVDIVDKSNKKNQKNEQKRPKTIRGYLAETTFTFDPEDENLLISKVNPNLMIRVISGGSRDEITFGFNFPHNFGNQTETFVKENISECERLTTVNSTHSVVFVKGPGAKWGVIGQQLVETMFSIYVNKYLFS